MPKANRIIQSSYAPKVHLGGVQREVTISDYHLATYANFRRITEDKLPQRPPDYDSSAYTHESDSRYWQEDGCIYRQSNHWAINTASCAWLLDGRAIINVRLCGYARLKDFRRRYAFTGKFIVGLSYKIGTYSRNSPSGLVIQVCKLQKVTYSNRISCRDRGSITTLFVFDKMTIAENRIITAAPHGAKAIRYHNQNKNQNK